VPCRERSPFGDYHRRDAVTDQIGQCAGFGHEAVDTKDQRDAGDRDRTDARQCGGENNEAAAGDPGRALRGQQQYREDAELLRQ
jgi:hypothetical protein